MDGTTSVDVGCEAHAVRERVHATLRHLSQTGEIPSLPRVATAALGVARDPDAEVEKLCRIVESDMGLAARLLRVSNSALFGRRTPAKDLRDAVLTVGFRQTCEILITAAARQLYNMQDDLAQNMWNHDLAVAVAAEEVARTTRRVSAGNAFLPGLFHDIGRVAFLLADKASFQVIQQLADEATDPRLTLEREWYSADHAEAGAILAEDWGIAPEHVDAIRWHHTPSAADIAPALATVINAADSLAYEIGVGTSTQPPEPIGLVKLGLEGDAATECIQRVREALERQQQLFGG
jgi:putative nucleotidyltransferase with HDIG domain